jgi:hypothetical protein
MASTEVGRGAVAKAGIPWRFVMLIAVNVVIVGGAAWYVLFKGSAPA